MRLGISPNGVSGVICYYKREANTFCHTVTCHLSVHVGKLGKACHQPNLFNELHKTVRAKKLGLTKITSRMLGHNATREGQIDGLRMMLCDDDDFGKLKKGLLFC